MQNVDHMSPHKLKLMKNMSLINTKTAEALGLKPVLNMTYRIVVNVVYMTYIIIVNAEKQEVLYKYNIWK